MSNVTQRNAKYVTHAINEWSQVLDHKDFAPIENPKAKAATAVLLENTLRLATEGTNHENIQTGRALKSIASTAAYEVGQINESQLAANLKETNTTGVFKGFDMPIVQMIRRAAPKLISHEIMGVQPLVRPSDYVFFLTSHYGGDGTGTEALHKEADTAYGGTGTHEGTDPYDFTKTYSTGTGLITAVGEKQAWKEMSMKIDRKTVEVGTIQMRSNVTDELVRDLNAVHGLDARRELEIILANETIAEINRMCVRSIYTQAVVGCQQDTIANKGEFDLDIDGDGTWSIEKYKTLMTHIDFEGNRIMTDTRRGKGNFIITTPDVASALVMSGNLDYLSGLERNISIDRASIGGDISYVGMANGLRVYVDPYATETNGITIGYVGDSPFDAGLVYCPYSIMEYYQGRNWDNLSEIGFGYKSRLGLTNSPFVSGKANENVYYRKFKVANLS